MFDNSTNASKFKFTIYCNQNECEPSKTSFSLKELNSDCNIFEFVPKTFKISTKNGSCYFNIEIINDTSPIISSFLKTNPDEMQFHLNINDDANVLKKIEQVYQGKSAFFNESDIPVYTQIIKLLGLSCFPGLDFLGNTKNFIVGIDNSTELNFQSLFPQNLTIKTRQNNYKCNLYGARASKVIDKFLNENPNSYVYNYDFDDEFGEFQPICDYFNCDFLHLRMKNIDIIKEISEDLQIQPIVKAAETFLNDYDNFIPMLDSQQEIVDKIDELFDLITDIKKKTVETVKNSILRSHWSKTEENVQELAAFFLQTINSNISLHHHLADLLIQLDKESNKTNKLDILVPLIVKILKKKFGQNFQNCSMIFNLYKRGAISRDEINRLLKSKTEIKNKYDNCGNNNKIESNCFDQEFTPYQCKALGKVTSISVKRNVLQWFLPEIIELNNIKDVNAFNFNLNEMMGQKMFFSISNDGPKDVFFIKSYFDKLDKYKQMRDNGEPNDELTLALRHDDVDKLQSITSTIHSNFENQKVLYNIFEDFIPNGFLKYIDYAAAYGSIKCFKYILLNHDKVDLNTFKYAVYGGNIEIIKIIEQKLKDNNNTILNNINDSNNSYNYYDSIKFSVIKHQNDIFDWIFEDLITKNKLDFENLVKIMQISIGNGNAHSINAIFDKCFEIYKKLSNHELFDIQDSFMLSSKNGFSQLTRFLINLFPDEKPGSVWKHKNKFNSSNKSKILRISFMIDQEINSDFNLNSNEFGNLSILKPFIKQMDQKKLKNTLIQAFEDENVHIIKYFFEHLLKEKTFTINEKLFDQLLLKSVKSKSSILFDYLMERVKLEDPAIIDKYVWKTNILQVSCSAGNVKVAKTITDFILNQNKSNNDDSNVLDFTIPFAAAAASRSTEICQFFVDKKVYIDFDSFAAKNFNLDKTNGDIFSLIIDNLLPEIRKKMYNNLYIPAILSHNKCLVEMILKASPSKNNGLIEAVNTHDIEIVKIIINYIKDQSFINKTSQDGTALIYAVKNDDIDIVKVLLSVPGIDPNLYDSDRNTPLIISAENLNFEIFNEILDFYGDNIQYELWQIEKIVHNFANKNNNNDNNNNKDNQFNWKTNLTVFKFFNRILDIKCIDSRIFDNNNNSFLMCACEANDIDLVKKLLKLDKINVNLYDSKTGNTPLFISLQNENYEISKLLISHPKININAKNFSGQTALVIAVQKHMDYIINLILKHDRFDAKESLLNYAYTLSTDETKECFSDFENIDVNDDSTFTDYQPLLIYAVQENNKNMLESIINHPSFDKKKSLLYEAIFKASSKNEIDIFKILITLVDDDFKKYKYLGKSILYFTPIVEEKPQGFFGFGGFNNVNINNVNVNNEDVNYILTEILNNFDFDFDKQDINDCFERFFSDMSIKQINNSKQLKQLFEYSANHNHYINFNRFLSDGSLYLTQERNLNDIHRIKFLLENGANPNIPDKSNNYPLEIAIKLNNPQTVKALIDSNKIDFNTKIPIKVQKYSSSYDFQFQIFSNDKCEEDSSESKYTTYLHLANELIKNESLNRISEYEYYNRIAIFQKLLDNKEIDINITDYMGKGQYKKKFKMMSLFHIFYLYRLFGHIFNLYRLFGRFFSQNKN